MPIEKSALGGVEPPKVPHLALWDTENGGVLGIPVGSAMALIFDPAAQDGILPLILAKVTKRAIYWKCACGNATCTKTYVHTLSAKGHHPPMTFVER